MNGYKESDSPIISEKPSNKTGDNKPVAENHYLPGTFRVIDVWEASEPFRAVPFHDSSYLVAKRGSSFPSGVW